MPGIAGDAFQKESGELTDLPAGEETSWMEPCPPGMKAVLAKTGEHSQTSLYPNFDVTACVSACPEGFVEWTMWSGRNACTLRQDQAEMEQALRQNMDAAEQKRDEQRKAKTAAAVVAGGSALALLAFLL